MQEDVAEAFVRTFQLTPEEVAIIKGSTREAPITQEFFTVLEKTMKIRNNTKYLLQVCPRCFQEQISNSLAGLQVVKLNIQLVNFLAAEIKECIRINSLCISKIMLHAEAVCVH